MLRSTITHSRRRAAVTALGIAAILSVAALAGCSQDTGVAALDREAGPADVLPADTSDIMGDSGFDEDSARFIGAVDDVNVYLVRGPATSPICVVLGRSASVEIESTFLGAGCGSIPLELRVSGGAEVRVISVGTETPEGFTRLDDNVVVRTLP